MRIKTKIIFCILFMAIFIALLVSAPRAATVTDLRAVTVQDPPGGMMIGVARPQWIDAQVLAANVAEVYTVPTGANYVLFSANNDFYANYGAAAAVPGTDVTDGTASELNPTLRALRGAATIGLISPYATVVTIAAYK